MLEEDGPAVEILSTRPLVPSIQAISDPDRLVIDLPNARLETPDTRIKVQADQIRTIRANQFQQSPPVARVVLDLLAPRAYTWDAAGNRLVVHLGKNPGQARSSTFETPAVPSLTSGPRPVVAAVRAAGPLALSGNGSSAGSAITAGPDTAVVRLSSGGEVHVCPGTTVSITPSQNRHNLMFGINTGALEAHLALDATSDSVMTPDFRILLVGPGEFHYAISADNQGNTCVRALPGNTASAFVTELLGDRTYQVKATDQLMFHSGQLDRVDTAVPLECGCPAPRDSVLRAATDLPATDPPLPS
ncbi:MAG: AMIN domain-containing protein, partial [Terriglobales bacterium]